MPKYVIERNIPSVGAMSTDALHDVAAKSNGVIHSMRDDGKDVQWVQSYVTGDKMYCVYNAPNEQTILEHAKRGGFPADRVSEVKEIIDPTTGE